MAGQGRTLFATLNNEVGFAPETAKLMFPLDRMFNMDYSSVSGDVFHFHSLVLQPVGNGSLPIGDCEVAPIECVGSETISLTIDRNWLKLHKLNNCRLSALNELSTQGAIDTVVKTTTELDRMYALAEAQVGVSTLATSPLITENNVTGINYIEAINKAILALQTANPLVPTSEYVLLISNTVASNIMNLKAGCCDFINGFVPDATAMAPFNVADTIILPDTWIGSGGGVGQYDYVLYIKRFAPYMFQCDFNTLTQMTNEHQGFLGYFVNKKWGFNVENFEPSYIDKVGLKGTVSVTVTP